MVTSSPCSSSKDAMTTHLAQLGIAGYRLYTPGAGGIEGGFRVAWEVGEAAGWAAIDCSTV